MQNSHRPNIEHRYDNTGPASDTSPACGPIRCPDHRAIGPAGQMRGLRRGSRDSPAPIHRHSQHHTASAFLHTADQCRAYECSEPTTQRLSCQITAKPACLTRPATLIQMNDQMCEFQKERTISQVVKSLRRAKPGSHAPSNEFSRIEPKRMQVLPTAKLKPHDADLRASF